MIATKDLHVYEILIILQHFQEFYEICKYIILCEIIYNIFFSLVIDLCSLLWNVYKPPLWIIKWKDIIYIEECEIKGSG